MQTKILKNYQEFTRQLRTAVEIYDPSVSELAMGIAFSNSFDDFWVAGERNSMLAQEMLIFIRK